MGQGRLNFLLLLSGGFLTMRARLGDVQPPTKQGRPNNTSQN